MFTALMWGFAAMLLAWNKRNKWYAMIPEREKENNWIIMDSKTGQDYKKWPKGHVVKLLVNPFQQFFEGVMGLAMPKSIWGMASEIALNISPAEPLSLIPLPIKMIIEPMLNYDLYWHKQIEAPTMKGGTPGMRFRKSTSETLKSIGKALNISPLMMEHELRSVFGGSGRNILYLTDMALGAIGVQEMPELAANSAIVVRRFVGKAEEWKSDMRTRLNTIEKRMSEIKSFMKSGIKSNVKFGNYNIKDVPHARELAYKELLKLNKKRYELLDAMSKLNAMGATQE
jgi:hypothetical protein